MVQSIFIYTWYREHLYKFFYVGGNKMAINLLKAGQSIELKKMDAGLRKVTLGLRWGSLVDKEKGKGKVSLFSAIFGGSNRSHSTASVDVDSAVILVNGYGRKLDRVYYAKRNGQGVYHAGDDRSGNSQYGKEDNEEIYITLNELNMEVKEIYVVANIFSGTRDFSDRNLRGSYVRLLNSDTHEELVRYELDDFKDMKGVILGKLYKQDNEWKFKALGQGVRSGNIEAIERTILA